MIVIKQKYFLALLKASWMQDGLTYFVFGSKLVNLTSALFTIVLSLFKKKIKIKICKSLIIQSIIESSVKKM